MTSVVKSSNLGYPRLGEHREWKKLLESYWQGKINEKQFSETSKSLRLENLKKQIEFGIDIIPVADNSNYDHVLDTTAAFNLIPTRFGNYKRPLTLDEYYAVARGDKDNVAADMTKWFNINYHYTVPEFDNTEPRLLENRWLKYWQEAKNELGIDGKPVIVGPVTLIKLGKLNGEYVESEKDINQLLDQILPLYGQVFEELQNAGVKWVQLDEPTLVKTEKDDDIKPYYRATKYLHEVAPKLNIELQTYFDSIDPYQKVVKLPVQAIGLDFVHGKGENLNNIRQFGFPDDKILVAGLIDGHNIWVANLQEKASLAEELHTFAPKLWLQPSNSLLHVPITKKFETKASPELFGGLAFADEKLQELVSLTKKLNGNDVSAEFIKNADDIKALNDSQARNNKNVQEAIKHLSKEHFERHSKYSERSKKQQDNLHLPLLPTTTIGSFPQSSEVRAKRAAWRKGDLSDKQYNDFIASETKRWIQLQEDIDLDVLVHGEFERTDMVEYFGQKLAGFFATQNGWVQSYGSRGVRPPVIFGDVAYTEPITVKESAFAQAQTSKPVKGMLTAPLTIINWSFVRDDISRATVQNQIALALRQEVINLEKAGIKIIQVDEPALREGLPLKQRNWQNYLDEAIYSFKITTTGVRDETQIHTHMCYSDFEDIISTISGLDADVISIETSRSHGEIISAFEDAQYDKQIGLGVYDIHSPRIPSVKEITDNIRRGLKVIDHKQFWVNPDCGLKTRNEEQTLEALKNLEEARNIVLAEL
ncbi:5-methyltetrahydropteroyltriglutamate--homocysteine methyltransferase [Leuconostoc litchii]|uniref:5-methyltetrahydropteroyltriglutamate--homocysteine methyltransferase n=1 Tax=Leuconostoc litchii TaxID=1981069 RepID=A0A652NEE9_9LACO|nr:5-methyltetrahydropteroyltriglutamate--homocysteine S-methyltransferase [Leuconostoc litchii]TYC46519.1 5-methyltetrahydropteroyltriglutamate--homocysteine S-methyltransferase [Leuconostoc litchii]GMA70164.1 5-methyltetrahydropteroyltriglutamate--homocysteine methyltransferase [Leuconostoc litchii]